MTKGTVTKDVRETSDSGFELEKYDLYPPLSSSASESIAIHHAFEGDPERYRFTYHLNGREDPRPGLEIMDGRIYINREFMYGYSGPWPALVEVRLLVDGQLAGTRLLRLRDTGSMVCAKVDMEFHPSAKVKVPQTGSVLVVAAPRFFDAEGIPLPASDLAWRTVFVDPMEGVGLIGHVLEIRPGAKPGTYRVATLMLNGMNRAKPLQLT